jgi:hypothetical protein
MSGPVVTPSSVPAPTFIFLTSAASFSANLS